MGGPGFGDRRAGKGHERVGEPQWLRKRYILKDENINSATEMHEGSIMKHQTLYIFQRFSYNKIFTQVVRS